VTGRRVLSAGQTVSDFPRLSFLFPLAGMVVLLVTFGVGGHSLDGRQCGPLFTPAWCGWVR